MIGVVAYCQMRFSARSTRLCQIYGCYTEFRKGDSRVDLVCNGAALVMIHALNGLTKEPYLRLVICCGISGFSISLPLSCALSSRMLKPFSVYGGGFTGGANNIYDGTAIVAQSVLMQSPVLLVAPNYRLNIYGWLNGAEALANNATNLGLKDQVAALRWVQEHIASFGGDPEKVTVQGESAGAISIVSSLIGHFCSC
jgi:hypothetical protein